MDARLRRRFTAALAVLTLLSTGTSLAERRAVVITPVRATEAAAVDAAMTPIKRLHRELRKRKPMREMRERTERHRELRKLARRMQRLGRKAMVVRGERSRPDSTGIVPAPPGADDARTARAAGGGPVPPPNVLVNNRTGDGASSGQSEVSIAAHGLNVIAAWNDGQGFITGGDGQGYAWSTDGGATWTDGGSPQHPAAFPAWLWSSDPVVAINEKTGDFYYCGLADTRPGFNGIGIARGRFTGSTFAWQDAALVREGPNSEVGLDKQWMAVDTTSGNLYMSYTAFGGSTGPIDFQRSTDNGVTWSVPLTISLPAENLYRVQGSRPAVGPDGAVYVMYYLIGLVDVDDYRVARSTNAGVSFGAPVTAASVYVNFGTGQPGFNREIAVTFASIAVDRSTGPRRGRVYLSWGESLNWYDDIALPHTGGAVSEVEPNDVPAASLPFSAGDYLRGSTSTSDPDWFRCTLAAGQSIVFYADSTASALGSHELMVFAADGTTRLAYTLDGPILFTAPAAGTYRLRARAASGNGSYRIQTEQAGRTTERGRDQADVFVASSADGVAWSTPVRVNESAPGYYEALPEIAVSAEGRVYVAWYDWRDAAATTSGGESHVYLARSDDGVTFTEIGATSDTRTAWSTVSSNIIPNQGDYIGLFADANNVYACWADGRPLSALSNPDIYVSVWPLALTPVQVALNSATAEPGRVRLEWFVDGATGFTATLERSRGDEPWLARGPLAPDGEGRITHEDTDVVAGGTYRYRLAVSAGTATRYYGEATVRVPLAAAFALEGVHPNPSVGNAWVTFSLPDERPARLQLVDVTGRATGEPVTVRGAGRHVQRLPDTRLAAGVYLVRITLDDRSLVSRFSIVR